MRLCVNCLCIHYIYSSDYGDNGREGSMTTKTQVIYMMTSINQ